MCTKLTYIFYNNVLENGINGGRGGWNEKWWGKERWVPKELWWDLTWTTIAFSIGRFQPYGVEPPHPTIAPTPLLCQCHHSNFHTHQINSTMVRMDSNLQYFDRNYEKKKIYDFTFDELFRVLVSWTDFKFMQKYVYLIKFIPSLVDIY